MTTPAQPQKRVRINVETSVKGVKTWSCTVEYYDCSVRVEDGQVLTGSWLPAVLADSDRLVAELERKYPTGGG